MKRQLLMVLVAIMGISASFAQSRYDESKKVTLISYQRLSCNTGEEKFITFIRKFKANKTFRASRVASNFKYQEAMSGTSLSGQKAIERLNLILPDETFSEYRKIEVYDDFDEITQGCFAVISADEVVYYFSSETGAAYEYEYIFSRINGKWYLIRYFSPMT
jgi:hypothetical protein